MKISFTITVFIILFLFICVEIVSDIVRINLFPDSGMSSITIKIAFFSLYVFLIVPALIKNSIGTISIYRYLEIIGLTAIYPLHRIIVVVLLCYITFVISQLSASLLYFSSHNGKYIFDFSRNSFLDSKSIISGFFEEIVFRGIILTLLLKNYSESKSIIISAVIFGGIHLLNIFNPDNHGYWVISQSIWAFGLGIMYGYIFVKMRSLIPLIILHYLINALVGVWFYGLDSRDFVSAMYGIPFFGLIPAFLSVLIMWLLSRRFYLDVVR